MLAPTGTIGFMMDCDTTGIEPDFSLVKFKKLVGGGSMQIVNQTMPRALRQLGYAEEQVEAIVEYIAEHGNVVDAPGLRPSTTRCSTARWGAGDRPDGPRADDGGRAAVPVRRDLQDGEHAGVGDGRGDRGGLLPGLEARPEGAGDLPRQLQGRPAAVRRQAQGQSAGEPADEKVVEYRPIRKRLPKSRPAMTTSFSVGGAEGYMTASSYPDDGLGEIFLKMRKQGSTLAGIMDAFSIAISIALQYGVPLETYVSKFINMRFEPAGMTDDPDMRMAQSIMDYIFRRLALDHLAFETRAGLGIYTAEERARELETGSYAADEASDDDVEEELEALAPVGAASTERRRVRPSRRRSAKPAPAQVGSSTELLEAITGTASDAPLCMTCGTKMRPAGSCYVCEGCGSTSGCS